MRTGPACAWSGADRTGTEAAGGAAGLAGGLGPLAVGFAAERFGLSWALGALVVVPVVVLAGSAGARTGNRSETGER
jgi:hypothetical protein